jgi:hypothetical protein
MWDMYLRTGCKRYNPPMRIIQRRGRASEVEKVTRSDLPYKKWNRFLIVAGHSKSLFRNESRTRPVPAQQYTIGGRQVYLTYLFTNGLSLLHTSDVDAKLSMAPSIWFGISMDQFCPLFRSYCLIGQLLTRFHGRKTVAPHCDSVRRRRSRKYNAFLKLRPFSSPARLDFRPFHKHCFPLLGKGTFGCEIP